MNSFFNLLDCYF